MKNLKILILSGLITILFFGCREKEGFCESEGYFVFEVTGYTDTIYERFKINDTEWNVNFLSKNDSVQFNYLHLQLGAELIQKDAVICSVMNDSLLGYIDTIYITSNNYYTNNYIANSNLNNIFNILYPKDNGLESDLISLNNYIKKKDKIKGGYKFLLKTPPDSSFIHTFSITIKRINGQEYKITSYPVIITP